MKCPHCGAWNQAYLPRCNSCGTPLKDNNHHHAASWEEAMHKKKPSLQVLQFEPGDKDVSIPEDDSLYDPEAVDRAELREELEELEKRRGLGQARKEQLREQTERVRRSIREAEVIRPAQIGSEPEREGDSAVISRRQQARQEQYMRYSRGETQARTGEDHDHGYFGNPEYEQPLVYADDDKDAPIYYDGYTPESSDPDDQDAMPRRIPSKNEREEISESLNTARRKKNNLLRIIGTAAAILCACVVIAGGALFGAMKFAESRDMQVRQENETTVEVSQTTVDGHPAHTFTIYGKENATVFFSEMQSSYVIADGHVAVTVPDYMWYDTESSTFAKAVETDTMDVTLTPFIRYSQEGDQYALEPIQFTIDVPLSPIYLLNPSTIYANVGVSIYEVRLNVEKGSTVVIDGTNVSTLIRETGNVSKNVQVLPVGENIISISVKSKYCRENKMEVTLYREAQDIPLELSPTVLVEWNYEPISEEKYASASDEQRAKMNIPSISGTTLPGAEIAVEFPHRRLEVDKETGKFSFVPLFDQLGDNEVVIRASIEGKRDSVITHTVYYMPNADLYTRRAWDLDSQYSDLINYISQRKGIIYVATGTIQRVISAAPQMAIMNIGSDSIEKLVMLENSSKTTWEVGTKYRIYGDVYGLYNNMPRLTVRYTYLTD